VSGKERERRMTIGQDAQRPISLDDLEKMFPGLLADRREHASVATGVTQQDCLYDQADSVEASSTQGYAFVTYRGERYGPAHITWGPLDADEDKLTVLIQTKEGKWTKLWFWESDLQSAD
jgi:hypothetical protein